MRTLLRSVLCNLFLVYSCFGGAHFVLPNSTGANTGVDWNNAWSLTGIGWGSVAPGDTIFIAGGTYTGEFRIGANGATGTPITIERVLSSDQTAVQAAGWQSGFDSQVVINTKAGSDGINFPGGIGNFVTIDGRVPAGIRINRVDNGMGIEIDQAAVSNVTLRYIQVWGPGIITQTGDVRAFDLTPTTGQMANVTMQYCESGGGGDSNVYITLATNFLMEHCVLHDADCSNEASFHPNVIYTGQITNSVFRYNKLYNIAVEGLFFGDPGNQNIQVYDNIFYQGSKTPNSGRAIQFDSASTGNSGIFIYNNTFASLPLGIQLGGSSTFSGCIFENNLSWNESTNLGNGWTNQNNLVPVTDPFISSSTFDYHLTANNNVGANLGSAFGLDYDGVSRPATGSWDAGAYQFVSSSGSPTPTPTPTVTPSPTVTPTPSPTATPSPSATATPTPTPTYTAWQAELDAWLKANPPFPD